MYENKTEVNKVLILGVHTQEWDDFQFDNLINEMKSLVDTAGGLVKGQVQQKLSRLDSRTAIGKGKLEEVKAIIDDLDIDLVVFLNKLRPIVQRNLEEALGVAVIDRVQLILDIFALRAKSHEGKLQVELAQNQYLLPRLMGQGQALSRLGGGIGTRGPGETKLETDRRHLRDRINKIKNDLKEMELHRERTREQRRKGKEFNIGLVGYTNAGKSTILSKLTESQTYIQDQLFATLDPLTRTFEINKHDNFTITDTVGFIEELPTELIHAFKSTLEEIQDVDLLLHVVDSSHPARLMHEATVNQLLLDLEMQEIPILVVYNKSDMLQKEFQASLFPFVLISAKKDADIDRLKESIWQTCLEMSEPYTKRIPIAETYLLHQYQSQTFVDKVVYNEESQEYIVTGFQRNDYY